MKGLFKRKRDRYWQMNYFVDGRRVYESTGTTEKRLAKAILAKRRADVAEGRHLDRKLQSKIGFSALVDRYWEKRGHRLKGKGVQGVFTGMQAFFGNTPAENITSSKIETYLLKRVDERGLKASTRNRHIQIMKAMFNWACKERDETHLPTLMSHNPANDLKLVNEDQFRRTRYLEPDEVEQLLDACSDSFRPFLITALHSGCRRSELFNLRWDDVDFLAETINIRNSKSGKPRTIPMDATLKATLSYLPSRFKKGWVFPSPVTGERLVDVKKQFQSVVKKAGLKDVTLHTCRHTFASTLVRSGIDLVTVARLMGHSTTRMTERYSHLSRTHQSDAVKKLDFAYKTMVKTMVVGNSVKTQSL